jgi:hypothetical protein
MTEVVPRHCCRCHSRAHGATPPPLPPQAISAGCFNELLATSLCVDPDAQKFKTGL